MEYLLALGMNSHNSKLTFELSHDCSILLLQVSADSNLKQWIKDRVSLDLGVGQRFCKAVLSCYGSKKRAVVDQRAVDCSPVESALVVLRKEWWSRGCEEERLRDHKRKASLLALLVEG